MKTTIKTIGLALGVSLLFACGAPKPAPRAPDMHELQQILSEEKAADEEAANEDTREPECWKYGDRDCEDPRFRSEMPYYIFFRDF